MVWADTFQLLQPLASQPPRRQRLAGAAVDLARSASRAPSRHLAPTGRYRPSTEADCALGRARDAHPSHPEWQESPRDGLAVSVSTIPLEGPRDLQILLALAARSGTQIYVLTPMRVTASEAHRWWTWT